MSGMRSEAVRLYTVSDVLLVISRPADRLLGLCQRQVVAYADAEKVLELERAIPAPRDGSCKLCAPMTKGMATSPGGE